MTRLRDVMPPRVIVAWHLSPSTEAVVLSGGMGRAIRVRDWVMKPIDDEEEAAWCQAVWSGLRVPGIRIPDPILAPSGAWVEAGWVASRYLPGVSGPRGMFPLVLTVSRQLHRALARIPRPAFLEYRVHRWSLADHAAWGERTLEWIPLLIERARRLEQQRTELAMPFQIIHGDLAGNVLFEPGLWPAVIDFSPYWRPASYADAIILGDGLLWYDWDEVEPLVSRSELFRQLLVRAILARLGALNERLKMLANQAVDAEELAAFDHVIAWLTTNTRWDRCAWRSGRPC